MQAALDMPLVRDKTNPDLTFPMVEVGTRSTPWDLRPLLYTGGARSHKNKVASLIDIGALGPQLVERIDLVRTIHEEIKAAIEGGGSRITASTQITQLRFFFGYADDEGLSMNIESVSSSYIKWTEHLLNRVRVVKDISDSVAYHYGRVAGQILDKVLERTSPILLTTHLTWPPKRKRVRGVEADKQRLDDTFAFGYALLDIIDALDLKALWGPLPLKIRLRSGKEWNEWSGQIPVENLRYSYQKSNSKKSKHHRLNWENDRTLRTRYPLVNLRIEAEMLIFIGQTGMNLSQTHKIKGTQFSYKACIDGYEVRAYKNRRGGEVLFEIFSQYREVFERYLKWRNKVFPDAPEGLLFPLYRVSRHDDTTPAFSRMRITCKKIGLSFIPPSRLRNTRVNWLLRRSRDPDLTAEMNQHHKQTLLRIYEEPSMQVSMTEITRFWQTADPSFECPAPGVCDGVPVPVADIHPEAPKPDCIHPAGCLWCNHHRDIDSEDYVWSMASMRHLHTSALQGFIRHSKKGDTNDPACHVERTIERLTGKLRYFEKSNKLRQSWVVESLARIDEASYHTHWHYLIVSIEGE